MASVNYANPLTEEHCECLDRALAIGAELLECLHRCRRAGLPVDDTLKVVQDNVTLATNLKREFAPSRT